MAGFSPAKVGQDFLLNLTATQQGCAWLASQQSVTVQRLLTHINMIIQRFAAAEDNLTDLQGAFTNQQIGERISEYLYPAPADIGASYLAARTAVRALLDDYGANVLPALPGIVTWDAVNRQHVDTFVDLDAPANFKANCIAARDALEVFT